MSGLSLVLRAHGLIPDTQVVDVTRDGEIVASIYPVSDNCLHVVSAFMGDVSTATLLTGIGEVVLKLNAERNQ